MASLSLNLHATVVLTYMYPKKTHMMCIPAFIIAILQYDSHLLSWEKIKYYN